MQKQKNQPLTYVLIGVFSFILIIGFVGYHFNQAENNNESFKKFMQTLKNESQHGFSTIEFSDVSFENGTLSVTTNRGDVYQLAIWPKE